MQSDAVEEFAKLIVQAVRDRAIKNLYLNLREDTSYEVANKWKDVFKDKDINGVFGLIPDAVDEVIAVLLSAIDDNSIKLYFNHQGRMCDLSGEGMGEMCGSYVVEDGWREKYSEERVNKF